MTRIYWPGTTTPISRGNAFDWRGEPSIFCSDRAFNGANQNVSDAAKAHADQNARLHQTRNPKPIVKVTGTTPLKG